MKRNYLHALLIAALGPETWEAGIVKAPHGIAFDGQGNILMTEYNQWGRVMKFKVQP